MDDETELPQIQDSLRMEQQLQIQDPQKAAPSFTQTLRQEGQINDYPMVVDQSVQAQVEEAKQQEQ